MDYNKTLSVIIPVYNTERYLKRCLDSALAALPGNSEILIVNDGSPDQSEEIALKYCEDFPDKVRYFYKTNGGLSDAKNYGLNHAEGEYIIFLDSDDYVEPDMYNEILNEMKQTGAQLGVCDINCEYEVDGSSVISCCYNPNRGSAFFQIMDTPLVAASWNKIIHRSLFEGLDYPTGLNNEDVAVTPLILARANRYVIVKKPMYKYVQRPGSIQNSKFSNKRFVIIDTTNIAIERAAELPIHIQRQIKGSLYIHQILGVALYPIRNQSFFRRYFMMKEFMGKVNSSFSDFFQNRYVVDNGLMDNRKHRIFKRLSVMLLKRKLYLVTSIFFEFVNLAEKVNAQIVKKGLK
ncbi:glycosyltransferase family 2 protein [Paenibacillus pedocola]|uniref:glycosyltransferase family 2 protein n=1 Tax=Paenibacillus pedocola TaxID=3242193 RepID=UPI0028776F9D|nr:glycosyltransferase family A protein [Paenibacillus typhae]